MEMKDILKWNYQASPLPQFSWQQKKGIQVFSPGDLIDTLDPATQIQKFRQQKKQAQPTERIIEKTIVKQQHIYGTLFWLGFTAIVVVGAIILIGNPTALSNSFAAGLDKIGALFPWA